MDSLKQDATTRDVHHETREDEQDYIQPGEETEGSWSLRDEGRSDGYGESYGERNT